MVEINIGTKRECEICKKHFLYKEMITIAKKPNERVGFDAIFETGYFYYCKNCYRNLKTKEV